MSRMKVAVIAGFATGVAFFSLIIVSASQHQSAPDMPVEDILNKLADTANDMKGTEAGPNVIIDSATVEEGKRLTYYYNVTSVRNGRYDRDRANEAEKLVRREACRDKIQSQAIKGGGVIRYAYRDAKGRHLFTIVVSQRICNDYV